MAKLTIIIPDDLDRRLRIKVAEEHGGKKGALGEAIKEAIELWLKSKTKKQLSGHNFG